MPPVTGADAPLEHFRAPPPPPGNPDPLKSLDLAVLPLCGFLRAPTPVPPIQPPALSQHQCPARPSWSFPVPAGLRQDAAHSPPPVSLGLSTRTQGGPLPVPVPDQTVHRAAHPGEQPAGGQGRGWGPCGAPAPPAPGCALGAELPRCLLPGSQPRVQRAQQPRHQRRVPLRRQPPHLHGRQGHEHHAVAGRVAPARPRGRSSPGAPARALGHCDFCSVCKVPTNLRKPRPAPVTLA